MNAKRIVVAAATLAAGALFAEGLTLVAAREKIVEAISSPAVMTATVSQLSADDQRQFLADVNAAIGNMPGSQEELAASYLNVCRAALKGAQKGNLATMIAEVFATVPVEYLPVISESLGSDMLNRAANPSTTYSDEEYLTIATNVMSKVNSRVEVEDNAGVRSGFAALAFIRGSNSSGNEAIVSALTAALPASVQETAAKEWFPAALAQGEAKSYDPMLVAASAETLPELDTLLLNVDGAQNQYALLADLGGANTDPSASAQDRNPIIDAIYNPLNESLPNLGTGSAFDTFTEGVIVPRGTGRKVPAQVPQKPSEPIHGYKWQTTR